MERGMEQGLGGLRGELTQLADAVKALIAASPGGAGAGGGGASSVPIYVACGATRTIYGGEALAREHLGMQAGTEWPAALRISTHGSEATARQAAASAYAAYIGVLRTDEGAVTMYKGGMPEARGDERVVEDHRRLQHDEQLAALLGRSVGSIKTPRDRGRHAGGADLLHLLNGYATLKGATLWELPYTGASLLDDVLESMEEEVESGGAAGLTTATDVMNHLNDCSTSPASCTTFASCSRADSTSSRSPPPSVRTKRRPSSSTLPLSAHMARHHLPRSCPAPSGPSTATSPPRELGSSPGSSRWFFNNEAAVAAADTPGIPKPIPAGAPARGGLGRRGLDRGVGMGRG